jgi:hypothetical protein
VKTGWLSSKKSPFGILSGFILMFQADFVKDKIVAATRPMPDLFGVKVSFHLNPIEVYFVIKGYYE